MTSVASVVVVVTVLASAVARTQDPGVVRLSERTERTLPTLEDAQRMFYSGRYEDATAITSSLCAADDLEACELRTSSLHFQIRRAMGESADRNRAWTMCAACPDLLSTFVAETDRARALARARVQSNPKDEAALFLLGKIDLNYVWLQLGTLRRKTGWDQYLGSEGVPGPGARTESQSSARTRRACVDRLHRRDGNAARHTLGARWRQQEEGAAGGSRGCQ